MKMSDPENFCLLLHSNLPSISETHWYTSSSRHSAPIEQMLKSSSHSKRLLDTETWERALVFILPGVFCTASDRGHDCNTCKEDKPVDMHAHQRAQQTSK
jgi:hypothetical protein